MKNYKNQFVSLLIFIINYFILFCKSQSDYQFKATKNPYILPSKFDNQDNEKLLIKYLNISNYKQHLSSMKYTVVKYYDPNCKHC